MLLSLYYDNFFIVTSTCTHPSRAHPSPAHPRACRLALVDHAKNIDKYYILQLIEFKKKFSVYRRSGRTGSSGQAQLDGKLPHFLLPPSSFLLHHVPPLLLPSSALMSTSHLSSFLMRPPCGVDACVADSRALLEPTVLPRSVQDAFATIMLTCVFI